MLPLVLARIIIELRIIYIMSNAKTVMHIRYQRALRFRTFAVPTLRYFLRVRRYGCALLPLPHKGPYQLDQWFGRLTRLGNIW